MFKPFIGDCINPECGRTGVIIPVRRGICQYCNHEEKQRSKKSNGSERNSSNTSSLRRGRGCSSDVGGAKVINGEVLGRDEEGYGGGSGTEGFIRVGATSRVVRKPIKKKQIQYRRKRTGEKEVFESIWNALEEKTCFVCGRQIGEPSASNFGHCIPKALNKYPLFKLNPENIKLLCHDSYNSCHHRWDHTPRSSLKESMWKKMFDLEKKLIEDYKNLKR